MTRPYRPANGTEGEAFIARWCGSCERDRAFREDRGDSCPIVAATLIFEIGDAEYPAAWVQDAQGPRCTAYEPTPDQGEGRLDDPRQVEMFA